MIIVTAKGKEFRYTGDISIDRGERFIIVRADSRDGDWSSNSYDGYFIEDVESIVGVDDKETT